MSRQITSSEALKLLDIGDLIQPAKDFRVRLEEAKHRIGHKDFECYPYDTLSNLWTFEKLLTGEKRLLSKLIGGEPLLDIGCADGDLAFFFESLGVRTQAIDNPVTNFNAMQGVRALKADLDSQVDIFAVDLDKQFHLPAERYGLVLLLGVLYHLKNPFYLLETLSKQARYCLISTTITESVPGLYETVTGTPVAYLADIYEINYDSTNYWVFSDTGFRRLLKRSNWEICDYLLVCDSCSSLDNSQFEESQSQSNRHKLAGRLTGDTMQSRNRIAAARAFCLVRSKFSDPAVNILYGKGWHAIEKDGWRWTERKFSVRLESSRHVEANQVQVKLFVPDSVLAAFGCVTLHAIANGIDLPPESYDEPGEYQYVRPLPISTGEGDVRIDFRLDQALPPDAADGRERGIIVSSLEAHKE
jgi:tRNA (mo5U34)-methyltransferase